MIQARKMIDSEAPGSPAQVGLARERPRVLVVEDDPHDRQIYGMMMCYNGFDVVFAGSGATALPLAERYGPDLVLLDVGLPDASGLDLCQELRSGPGTPPVIVLSGFAESRLGAAARRAGCTRYIEKPTNPVEVLHQIEALIGKAPLAGVGTRPRILNHEH
jgi:DNA-binding response OmpR family regulator